MAVIFGAVLTVIGIGCAIMAGELFIGANEGVDPGMAGGGIVLGVISLIAFIGAIVLFVKAYRSRKDKK